MEAVRLYGHPGAIEGSLPTLRLVSLHKIPRFVPKCPIDSQSFVVSLEGIARFMFKALVGYLLRSTKIGVHGLFGGSKVWGLNCCVIKASPGMWPEVLGTFPRSLEGCGVQGPQKALCAMTSQQQLAYRANYSYCWQLQQSLNIQQISAIMSFLPRCHMCSSLFKRKGMIG